MKQKISTVVYTTLVVCVFCAFGTISKAEQQVYTFDVCGAPNSYEPGWVPNGDPMVNGKMTLIIDSAKGLLTLKPDCNARLGRTLANRDFGLGDKCNRMLHGVTADDFFLDATGVAWLDENGNLTENAIAHGYDLETEYLFYNYRDNGQSDRWGGPDGGAGGLITGDAEGRCTQWPPKDYGLPHTHKEDQ